MVVVTSTPSREHGARQRAREALRPRPRRGGHRRWSRDRVWHPAERLELAGLVEPGRVEISAAVQRVRLSDGRRTAGDDELFAHLVALTHVLYAKAHTEARGGSAHFATTYEQIMAALVAKFGIWGPAPAPGTLERERWVKDHRPRLYDWLVLLRRAGLISEDSGGVKDNAEVWWRTEVTVLGVPADLSPEELTAAEAYTAAFGERERDRRRRGRVRPYAEIFRAAKAPTRAQKARRAIATARAGYRARRFFQNGSSGGPFSPTGSPTGTQVDEPQTLESKEAFAVHETSLDRTGVRKRPRPGSPGSSRRLRRRESAAPSTPTGPQTAQNREPLGASLTEGEAWCSAGPGRSRSGAVGRLRAAGPVSASDRALWVQEGVQMAQALRRGAVDLSEPAGLEALTRAWYLQRYGEDEMMRLLPRCPRFDVAELLDAAALYRRHVAARLPGMPEDPAGALLLAGRRAKTPAPRPARNAGCLASAGVGAAHDRSVPGRRVPWPG